MRRFLPLAALLLAGCVDRLISVRSDPPGATVTIDGEIAGVTPVEIPYTWYGTRDITLEMKGYRSVSRKIELATPVWQIFPLDFVTDVLVPFRITDRTELHFLMESEATERTDIDVLKGRADELRRKLGP